MIIAILITVLIPTFMGAKKRAQDRAMQSSLRNGLTAAKVVFTDHGDYTLATVATLSAAEPGLTFVDGGSTPTGQNTVSVNPASASYIVLAGQSNSGTCFFLADDESAASVGVQYASGSSGTCDANAAPAVGDPAWSSAW